MGKVIELKKGIRKKTRKREIKTDLTDQEFYSLVRQYARWYHLKAMHIWKLYTEEDDIFGELAVAALESRAKYDPLKNTTLRTFYIGAFRQRMGNYRRYLYVRQVKNRMIRIKSC